MVSQAVSTCLTLQYPTSCCVFTTQRSSCIATVLSVCACGCGAQATPDMFKLASMFPNESMFGFPKQSRQGLLGTDGSPTSPGAFSTDTGDSWLMRTLLVRPCRSPLRGGAKLVVPELPPKRQ